LDRVNERSSSPPGEPAGQPADQAIGQPGTGPAAVGGVAQIETSARSQSMWMTLARSIAAVLTMAIPIVLVRVLDQTTFGHYKQLFLVSSTAIPLLSLGLPGSLYYFVPRDPERSQRFHGQTLLMLSLMGLVGGIVIFLARDPLSGFFDAPLQLYVGWIALYTALAVPASLLVTSPMVDRRARLAALLLTTFDLTRSGALIAVALISGELTAILIAACGIMLLQTVGALVYLVWRGQGRSSAPTRSNLRDQLAYALPFTGAALIGLAQMKIHAYYVAATFSAAQFAVYAVATLEIPLIGQFSRTVGEVVILETTKEHSKRNLPEVRRLWYRATHVLAMVLFPLFMMAEFFAPDMIELLFGASYSDAAPIFRVYLLIIPLSIFLGSAMLRATRDLGIMVAADTISLLATIGVLVFVARPWGVLGAVASLVVGRATFMAVASRRTARRLELSARDFLPWRTILSLLGLSAASAALAFGVTSWLDLDLIYRLVVGGSLATGGYTFAAWHTGLVAEEEKVLVRRRLQALSRWRGGPSS
jgi:O-antigen/teichoic acid export membrane protein